jgi:hypothetical protein
MEQVAICCRAKICHGDNCQDQDVDDSMVKRRKFNKYLTMPAALPYVCALDALELTMDRSGSVQVLEATGSNMRGGAR